MSTAAQHKSFSAHGGMRDIPRGAVRLPKEGEKSPKVERKSRAGVLFLVLVMCCALFLMQNRQQILAYVSKPVRVVKMAKPLSRANENNIRAALAAHMNAGFFALDVQAIKSTLEADPWIEKAVITRVWPDTLSVAITEEVAIARWGHDALLNQYGESFAPELRDEDNTLPLLAGPQGMERKVMEQYQAFSQMLSETGLRIREIALSERGSWTLRLDNEVQINIGRSQVQERVQRFVTFYREYLHTRIAQVATVDLRYNNGISIRNRTDMPVGVASK